MRAKHYFFILSVCLAACAGILFTVFHRTGRTEASVSAETAVPVFGPQDDGEAPKPVVMVLNMEAGQEIILKSYHDPALREWALAFFEEITGSEDVAAVILSNAVENGIPPALAFALCYEESRYNPRAVNQNGNGTVDRGLFQLNSATFPKLKVQDFYDPGINARLGLSHLAWCLKIAGTDVAGLAMYNAGHNRVRSAGTPKVTLDYVSRILKKQRKIEDRFMADYIGLLHAEIGEKPKRASFRLSLLMPLGGR